MNDDQVLILLSSGVCGPWSLSRICINRFCSIKHSSNNLPNTTDIKTVYLTLSRFDPARKAQMVIMMCADVMSSIKTSRLMILGLI